MITLAPEETLSCAKVLKEWDPFEKSRSNQLFNEDKNARHLGSALPKAYRGTFKRFLEQNV